MLYPYILGIIRRKEKESLGLGVLGMREVEVEGGGGV